MQRRIFLKNTITTSVGMIVLPFLSKEVFGQSTDALTELEKNFLNPPASARPWCFWMWMNGNITKEGITADLEAMKRMGIGGVINFNSAVGIPRGPVDYASDEWMDATAHAVRECNRLGIEMTLHNSPGYSGAGGPWITPEMSMQQLVWTETLVTSNGTVNVQLPKPSAKQNYYRDAFVVAYPSLLVEKALMKDKLVRVLANGKEIDKNIISDGNAETKIRVEGESNNLTDASNYDITSGTERNTTSFNASNISLVFEFAEPFEARAISITRKPETPKDLFDGPRDHPPLFFLESSDDGVNYKRIGTVRAPELRAMDTPAAMSFNPVAAKYYRLLLTGPSWICDVELHNGPRLGGWPGKTSYTHGDSFGETPGITNDVLIDPSKVIDITSKMDRNGQLQWNAPPGKWTILRIGHTTTGEENAAHPDAGNGLELDKFRKEALDFHFAHFLDKFISRIKPFVGKSFKGITTDSWEAGKQNWSVNFPSDFKQRRNYDIVSWMPALTGRIVSSVDDTERFLWDVRKTQADLLSENFYGHFAVECHKRGLVFNAEPYGDGNFDSLQVAQYLDIPMSEFWTRYIYGSDNYSKQAVSAAHVYGRKVAAAEAFTAMPTTSKWTDYPYSLKAEGDYFFTLGINRLVFHTFVHQPYMTGKPGMTMGPFGMHIDRNNSWTEQAYGWIDHLKRAQYLLQQGLAVADVCYFKGDNPQSGVPDIYTILPNGYAGDVFGPDALQNRMKVEKGQIVFPDGMHYRLCILAPLENMVPSSLDKIRELVADGMILLVNNKPYKSYGHAFTDEQVKKIADELYGSLDGKNVTERAYGNGKIIWGKSLKQTLDELNIQPDFTYTAQNQDATIHYIHKVIGDTEFYYVSNHRRRKENAVCCFRTNGRQPEIWNSENGVRYEAALYQTIDNRIQIPLTLEPAGALFVVFRKKPSKDGYLSVSKDGKEFISTKSFPLPKQNIYADVQNNFSISLWAKPDTFAHSGRSMLFHAPQGETVYGNGHAAMALSAGQNGIRVYERTRNNARVVLEAIQSLEGWTHIIVVYQNGKPSIYVNSQQVAVGKASSNIIHTGVLTPASQEQFASYFEGNYTKPELFKEVLSDVQINKLYQQGLPAPELPDDVHIEQTKEGNLKAMFWQNGNYSIEGSKTSKKIEVKDAKVTDVTGAWTVKFPIGSGAPLQIHLPELMSLHKYPDFNVKHFSGTATYLKTFVMAATDLQSDNKVFLDLGRVEVIAEVKLNGKKISILWKEPFRLEITNALKAGTNNIEVQVTNLWPNRMIGDEQLPQENEYSEHRFIKKLPDWYVKNLPKPGRRITFSTWKNFSKTDPLLESGLLGPVRLITAIEKFI